MRYKRIDYNELYVGSSHCRWTRTSGSGINKPAKENTMKTKNKSGFSLVEIMVAALLLAVLAIGGAAVMYQTGGNIQIQGNKRIALELANEVLERYQSIEYSDIPSSDTDTISVDGIAHLVAINSTIEHFPSPSPSVADEYKQIEVRVSYRSGLDNVVVIDSIIVHPYGFIE